MGINWFEILTQIFNFFILLFLLNKFLFKPIMAAMEKRESEIANTVKKADEKLKEAKELVNEYEAKVAEIKDNKEQILTEYKNEARTRKEELIEQYREETLKKKNDFEKELENEQIDFLKRFQTFLADYTIKVAKKVLSLISKTTLEEKTFEGFLEHLDSIDQQIIEDERKIEEGSIDFTSSNEISEDNKKILIEKIAKILAKNEADLIIGFIIDPDLIYGYKLTFNTFTVNENVNHYLSDLNKEVLKNQKF